jgi:hypothetical protein
MQAELEPPRSNALFIACVIWAAGVLAALTGSGVYIAVHAYDPTVSCDELVGKARRTTKRGEHPPNPDAWDDWELLCGYYEEPTTDRPNLVPNP